LTGRDLETLEIRTPNAGVQFRTRQARFASWASS